MKTTKEVDRLYERVTEASGRYRRAQQIANHYRAERERLEQKARELNEAQSLAQEVATNVQKTAHSRISTIVGKALSTVFDEPYKFKILFEQKRGKTDARLVFIRNGHEIDPLTGSGGGVVDVAAFALRLSALILSRPRVRRVLVLDEPFKFLAVKHRPRLKELLETLAKELEVQFIIVTHMDELKLGTVINLGDRNERRQNQQDNRGTQKRRDGGIPRGRRAENDRRKQRRKNPCP